MSVCPSCGGPCAPHDAHCPACGCQLVATHAGSVGWQDASAAAAPGETLPEETTPALPLAVSEPHGGASAGAPAGAPVGAPAAVVASGHAVAWWRFVVLGMVLCLGVSSAAVLGFSGVLASRKPAPAAHPPTLATASPLAPTAPPGATTGAQSAATPPLAPTATTDGAGSSGNPAPTLVPAATRTPVAPAATPTQTPVPPAATPTQTAPPSATPIPTATPYSP
jgi:hypothetical protein